MNPAPVPHRRSFVGPVILICIGVFFLVANLVPSFDPWLILARYWPVILILIGLGRIWDYYAARRYGGAPGASDVSGVLIAVVLLMLLLGLGVWRHDRHRNYNEQQSTQTVDLQGANAVTANLQIPAGQLNISGGSSHLADADFHYNDTDTAPMLNYAVEGGHGQLTFNGNGDDARFGDHDDIWTLHFNDAVPLDLTLQMGAGHGNLDFSKVNLTHLEIHMGVGQMLLDLTGPRKQDLSGDIQGGIGQARIRLPSDVGVRVQASGGIGSINVSGLTKQGDEYVNAVYGKTPATIDLTVHGGIGEIDLNEE
jgi:hypothetical protein